MSVPEIGISSRKGAARLAGMPRMVETTSTCGRADAGNASHTSAAQPFPDRSNRSPAGATTAWSSALTDMLAISSQKAMVSGGSRSADPHSRASPR